MFTSACGFISCQVHNWLNDHYLDAWIGYGGPSFSLYILLVWNHLFFSYRCINENLYAIELRDHNNLTNHILVAATDQDKWFISGIAFSYCCEAWVWDGRRNFEQLLWRLTQNCEISRTETESNFKYLKPAILMLFQIITWQMCLKRHRN
jgi:hypothetical protein